MQVLLAYRATLLSFFLNFLEQYLSAKKTIEDNSGKSRLVDLCKFKENVLMIL